MSSSANPPTEAPQETEIGIIRKLMKPLVERSSKSAADLCNEYANLTKTENPKEIDESLLWSLLADLSDKNPQIKDRYIKIIKTDPELIRSVLFIQWLEKEYRKTPEPTEPSQLPYYYLRSGQFEKFLETIAKNKINDWKIAVYAGGLSQREYKTWRYAARNYSKSKHATKEDITILGLLSGDYKICSECGKTFYDQVWAKLFCMLCDAESQNPYDLHETMSNLPKPTNSIEKLVLLFFYYGVKSIENEQLLSLSFKVHAISVFQKCPVNLIKEYIQPLIENFVLGMAFFYCSLTDTESAITLVSEILIGLPYPQPKAVQITDYFNLPTSQIVDVAIDRIILTKVDDFDSEITEEELIDRKIDALGWLELAHIEDVAEKKVRKLLGQLALNKQYQGCSKLLIARGNLLKNPVERDSWNALVIAEMKTNAETLSNVLLFRGGWMNKCDIDDDVARSIILLVTNQLIDYYMADGDPERALAVAAMICCPTKNMLRWVKKEDAKNLILKIKNVGIAKYKAQ